MTFKTFRAEVFARKITLARLVCDVAPDAEILDLMDRCPKYEQFAMRIQREAREGVRAALGPIPFDPPCNRVMWTEPCGG